MKDLVQFFENQSSVLKPYRIWFGNLPIVIFLLLGLMAFSFRFEQGLPSWLFNVGIGLMPIFIWSWGLFLVVGWFNSGRKKLPRIIEFFQSIFLLFWFCVPVLGLVWLI
jgi:hypothetical protein